MKNVQLRKATNEDIEIVLQILNTSRLEYLPYAKSPNSLDSIRGWVQKQLIPSGDVVIARHGSEDVGVLATSISDGIGWIDQLYLAPGYVGLGIGSELLKADIVVNYNSKGSPTKRRPSLDLMEKSVPSNSCPPVPQRKTTA